MTLVKSLAVKPTAKNGTETPKTTVSAVETPKNDTKKDELPKVLTVLKSSTETESLLPLEERIHRLNQLFELQGKYNRLLATKQKLNDFKLNQKTENITLSLEEYNNRNIDFETKNPEVIEAVINCIKESIDKKIKAIEPLLKW